MTLCLSTASPPRDTALPRQCRQFPALSQAPRAHIAHLPLRQKPFVEKSSKLRCMRNVRSISPTISSTPVLLANTRRVSRRSHCTTTPSIISPASAPGARTSSRDTRPSIIRPAHGSLRSLVCLPFFSLSAALPRPELATRRCPLRYSSSLTILCNGDVYSTIKVRNSGDIGDAGTTSASQPPAPRHSCSVPSSSTSTALVPTTTRRNYAIHHPH
ncbi:hypothetical protein C8Q72DRAFT_179713 [Fomitopsis betulina]|nr:hypothetical protein C8Q72DRAFT_179713 [Fomitopsis betulina]